MIGDPSGKKADRILLDEEVIDQNTIGIRKDLERLIDFEGNHSGGMLVNNFQWYKYMSNIHFVREIGKHFRVNTMLSRDSVKSRYLSLSLCVLLLFLSLLLSLFRK